MTKKKSVQYKVAYYDETGKRRGKTFTAPTMRLARLKAAEWELNHRLTQKPSMTVLDAVNSYIEAKSGVLSPSTVRSYKGIVRSHLMHERLGKMPLSDLSPLDIQAWLMSKELSPKTVACHYALLKASIIAQNPAFDFKVISLPQKEKKAPIYPV